MEERLRTLSNPLPPGQTAELRTADRQDPNDLNLAMSAIGEVLPELARISRYERRAAIKRDKAVRRLLDCEPMSSKKRT